MNTKKTKRQWSLGSLTKGDIVDVLTAGRTMPVRRIQRLLRIAEVLPSISGLTPVGSRVVAVRQREGEVVVVVCLRAG